MPDSTNGDAQAPAKTETESRRFWNVFLIVVVGLVSIVAVSTARKVRKDRHAFLRFRTQSTELLAGNNVYDGKSRFSYLPIFAMLL